MRLTIILSKDVSDIEEAQTMYDWIKHVIEPQTELKHRAQVNCDITVLDGIPPGG